MKMLINVALVLATVASVAVAQGKADLDQLGEKIATQLESRLPGWRYKPVEPFGPSSNILVQKWSSENRGVMFAVAVRQSVEDAKKEIKSFLQFRREPEELSGLALHKNSKSNALRRSSLISAQGLYLR
jgi:hypothetical protein